ncbi:MAG: AAA family ATPase [Verrucomicrobia bacterium]|nr:AAA family ATPase [Verrucomicrobiota bacterium]
MYLKSIRLRNIKCFGDATVDFSSGDSVRRWTTFFGRNGLGKSTLLQAIGAILAGPSAVRELLPTADGWVKKGQPWGEITAEIMPTEGDASVKRPRMSRPYEIRYLVSGGDPSTLPEALEEKPTVPEMIAWSGEGNSKEKESLTKDRKLLQQTAYAEDQQGWLACGYGPFRRLSAGAEYANQIVARQRRSARFVTLFREDAALTNATAWLLERYSAAREDPKDARKLEVVKQAIAEKLLPETAGLVVNARSVKLRRHDGSETSFQDLSDGYRSMLALSVDLLRWLTQAFPDHEKPLECPGVVVVDELDAHLHPDWQRRIGHWLRQKFPNIQFIVATHSPFLAQVAGETPPGETYSSHAEGDATSGNIKLEESLNGVVFVASTEPAQKLQADQILQSELFALNSLYAGPVEDRLNQYRGLRAKKRQGKLSDQEESQFQQLELWANTLPQTATATDREEETFVRQALDRQASKIRELE